MLMEEVLVPALLADSSIASVVGTRLFAPSALGQGDKPALPEIPFMAWREMPSQPYQDVRRGSNATLRTFQIFAYDHPGDVTRIGNLLIAAKAVCKSLETYNQDGFVVMDVWWRGESQPIEDPDYECVAKYGMVDFAVNQ